MVTSSQVLGSDQSSQLAGTSLNSMGSGGASHPRKKQRLMRAFTTMSLSVVYVARFLLLALLTEKQTQQEKVRGYCYSSIFIIHIDLSYFQLDLSLFSSFLLLDRAFCTRAKNLYLMEIQKHCMILNHYYNFTPQKMSRKDC